MYFLAGPQMGARSHPSRLRRPGSGITFFLFIYFFLFGIWLIGNSLRKYTMATPRDQKKAPWHVPNLINYSFLAGPQMGARSSPSGL